MFTTSVLQLPIDFGQQRHEAGQIARGLARLDLAQCESAEAAERGGQFGFG
jgi:hypothetical protein